MHEHGAGVAAEDVLVVAVDVVVALLTRRDAPLGEKPLGAQERAVRVRAKVRQVYPAEHPVPVDVVGLRAPEALLGLPDLGRRVEDAAARELFGHDEHPLVERVRLRILRQEVAPRRQRDERPEIVLQRVPGLREAARRGRIEGPLAHLVIRPTGEVHPPGRLLEDPGVLEGRGLKEVGLRDLGEEVLEPAVLVHALIGAGPCAELLTIVRVDDELRAGGLPLAELLHRLAHVAERDEIPEPGVGGIEDEREALVLGDEGLAELVAAQTGLEEVLLVEDGVRDAGLGQDGRQVRLPDALGEPRPEGPAAEDRGDPVGERADLPDGIAPGDADEDRLVVAAGEELDLAALHEVGEVADDVRAVALEPVEERAGEVEGGLHFGVPIERGHERRIRALGHVREHMWEVPGWLVLVENQGQTELVGHLEAFYQISLRRTVCVQQRGRACKDCRQVARSWSDLAR